MTPSHSSQRRSVLRGMTVLALGASLAGASLAQAWPVKPLRLLVPYTAGSPPDLSSRVVATYLATALQQPVVVENKPGAIGLVALQELLRQPADGYTLYCLLTPVTTASALLPAQKVDLAKELQPVSQISRIGTVLVVNNDLPATDMKSFVALLRAKPNQLNFASTGNGTPAHLAGELFKNQEKVQASHVPYQSFSQSVPDLLSNRVQFMFMTSSVAAPLVNTGKVRALGIVGPNRLPILPSVPTLSEQGMGKLDTSSWDAIVVKAGTPRPIVERLHTEIARIMAKPEVKAKFVEMGMAAVSSTPEELGALIEAETARWGAVIKAANITAN
ncbi:Bug family tripartite tricarboxylate transporter substrate binding protein [Ramlibacter sp. MAHUQ-53]|uniref:Bug family tripartite tricarboxylate transporter substrate binding protein n=1 Tax=unclassified Ramlibacter TaxID=2617605 RepID=UPI003624AE8D